MYAVVPPVCNELQFSLCWFVWQIADGVSNCCERQQCAAVHNSIIRIANVMLLTKVNLLK